MRGSRKEWTNIDRVALKIYRILPNHIDIFG